MADWQCCRACVVVVVLTSLAFAQTEPPALLGLPSLSVAPSSALAALGEDLFFEKLLSSDGSISCADCHRPDRAFADSRNVSAGVLSRRGDRNTPTLLNVRFMPVLFWDGRSSSLEDQARYPLTGPHEMNMRKDTVVQALSGQGRYAAAFAAAFGSRDITFENVCAALAAYQRTLVAGASPFDRFYSAGETDAITPSARRGWELFRGPAGCITCHRFDDNHRLFSDYEYHNTGIGWDSAKPDLGRYLVTRDREDRGRFRTPGLRNVSLTAPYMHDGSVPDLESVLRHYVGGGIPNRYLDPRIRPLALDETAQGDLVAWLRSLEGPRAAMLASRRAARGKP